jgi:hypothetical protein
MSVTEKTRKLLWARSGNQCAYCRAPLIATTPAAAESVVGDECHIVSGAPDGPRADLGYPREKLDTCENLLLLCRVHHKLVDDHPHEYPGEALRKLKARHEHRVAAALAASAPRNPDYLLRIETGADLLTIVIGAYAYQYSHDEPSTDEEAELIAAFLQNAQDWGDIGDTIESGERVRTGFALTRDIKELEQHGLWVFGARTSQKVNIKDEVVTWPVAVLRLVRASSGKIITVPLRAGPGA